MPATDRSSTRSPERWAAKLRPSTGHRLAIAALALLALRALWIAALAPTALALGAAGIALVAARALRTAGRPRRLALDAEGLWTITDGLRRAHRGRLLAAGYRDARLVVLVIENAAGARRRVAVTADAVDAQAFSFLHLALMLLAEEPARARPG